MQLRDMKKQKNQKKYLGNNIKRLYGSGLKTSISRLEQYKRCPFSFHLKYGLKLKEKDNLKIKAIDTGSFMHDVIDSFFDEVKDLKSIDDMQIENITNDIIENKLSLSQNYIFTSTPKFIILTNRLKKVIIQSIKYIVEQMKNTDFETIGHELEFNSKIGNVEIKGKIDRLDSLTTKDGKYIRIIDYKSSNKNIDLNEFVSGTQIQLITYLDSIVEKNKENIPAGMLYFNLIDPIIKTSNNKTAEEIEKEIKKKFKMNGLILANVNIIKKMDKSLEKGSSLSVPVYLDKDGNISISRSSTISIEGFTLLQKTARKIINQIAKEILDGNISIKPAYYKKTKTSACKYCEFKSICGFDPKVNAYSFIENKSKEEVLEELKGGNDIKWD